MDMLCKNWGINISGLSGFWRRPAKPKFGHSQIRSWPKSGAQSKIPKQVNFGHTDYGRCLPSLVQHLRHICSIHKMRLVFSAVSTNTPFLRGDISKNMCNSVKFIFFFKQCRMGINFIWNLSITFGSKNFCLKFNEKFIFWKTLNDLRWRNDQKQKFV